LAKASGGLREQQLSFALAIVHLRPVFLMLDLTGKTAIVTGATRGIGRAIAEALLAHGACVAIAARSAQGVTQAVRELAEGDDARILGVPTDVGRYQDCRALVTRTIDRFGRLDILINNAGLGGFRPVIEMTPEHWQAIIDTNLSSLFYCSHEAIPHLRQAGGGWIINMGSLAGKNAFAGGSAYNASKFGLIGFSEALMQEVRYDGIRVSYIMPGSVATGFEGNQRGNAAWKIQPQDVAQIVVDLLAMPARTLPSRVEVRPTQPARR
jgi:NAD(P)-dependent dehydrogenase (short-subunit alcohol dehydrogenase family)